MAAAASCWAAIARRPLLPRLLLGQLEATFVPAGNEVSPLLPCCCGGRPAIAEPARLPLLRLPCMAASRAASAPAVAVAAPGPCNASSTTASGPAASPACNACATAVRKRSGIPSERAVSSGSAASSPAVEYQLSNKACTTSLAKGRPSCSQVRRTASPTGMSACTTLLPALPPTAEEKAAPLSGPLGNAILPRCLAGQGPSGARERQAPAVATLESPRAEQAIWDAN